MRSSHSLDRLDLVFDDDRLVADAGLLLPATLAAKLGLKELVERHLDLGAVAGRANAGDKLLTLAMSASSTASAVSSLAERGRRVPVPATRPSRSISIRRSARRTAFRRRVPSTTATRARACLTRSSR